MFEITAFYAGLIGLLLIALSARVITYRRSNLVSLGDAGDKVLMRRIRAQANCVEYAPIGLILLALIEAQPAPAFVVHGLGVMLVAGRVMHGLALSSPTPKMQLRVGGMLLTLTMLGLSSVGLVVHALV